MALGKARASHDESFNSQRYRGNLSGQARSKTWKQSAFSQKIALLKQANGVQLKLTVRELVNFGRFPYSKGRLKALTMKK